MGKLIAITLGMIAAIAGAVGFAMSLNNLNIAQNELESAKHDKALADKDVALAEEDVAYEYGKCVFYYERSVEECNESTDQKGLPLYQKYYGDGSWTVDKDPDPET